MNQRQRRAHIRVLLNDLMPAIEKMARANSESFRDTSSTIRELHDRLTVSSREGVADAQDGGEGWASGNQETETAKVAKRLRPFYE